MGDLLLAEAVDGHLVETEFGLNFTLTEQKKQGEGPRRTLNV